MHPDLASLRREYVRAGLSEAELEDTWARQLRHWFADVAGLEEPNAMVLATAAADGTPSARTVLLKGFDERGLVFFTNRTSRKGRELTANPRASVVLPWHDLQRQVIAVGPVEEVAEAESDAYFAVRPREAQLGAWASDQSAVIASRELLDERLAQARERFADGEVPRPPYWGGYRLVPESVEFWQGRGGRLHDRLRFRRTADGWVVERLAP